MTSPSHPATGTPDPTGRTDRSVVAELVGAGVSFAGRPALRDVDLVVGSGDSVALLGANGSGKSTLVRALLGLTPLAVGQARLFDVEVGEFRDWGRVGYVPQRSSAAGGVPATVREVVSSGRLAHRRLFRPLDRTDREAVDEALEVVGLADRGAASVATLSGGQQQRVLIARALATRPDLLVLDEPVAGVDLGSQQAFADAVGGLVDRGTTVLVVLHEVGPLATLLHRAVVLRGGRVVTDGPPDSALHEPEHHHGHHHPDPRVRTDAEVLLDVAAPLDAVRRSHRGR